MAQFTYKARRRSGEVVTGVLDVNDRGAALMQIERLGLFPIAVEVPKGAAALAAAAAAAGDRSAFKKNRSWQDLMPAAARQHFQRKRAPKLQQLATYTTQLANLLKCGMPLTVALGSMSHLGTKGIPSEVSIQLKQDVMEGKGLSEAMAKQPIVFSNLYVNMVRAGEQSGALVDVLRRMADHFERFAEVQQKFRSAMIYPIFVFCVGICISIFFMTVMLPSFLSLFTSMGNIKLPLATRILVGINNFFQHWWWVMALVIFAIVLLFNRFRASEYGKQALDQFRLKAPIMGRVNRMNLFGQFARVLSTLLMNGVPVLAALEITEQIMPNRIMKEAIAKTRQQVTDGKTLAEPLARSKLFPQLMVDLIKIGEETGDVPGALANLAETYEGELNLALKAMMSMIEPVMICIMAIGVGFLLVSVLSALFSITSNIQV